MFHPTPFPRRLAPAPLPRRPGPRLPRSAGLALVVGLACVACSDDSPSDAASTEPEATAETTTAAAPAVVDPGDGGYYRPDIDPAAFVDAVDHPYFPLAPGARWVYEGETDEGTERVAVEVTEERREVMGISAVVVRDTVYLDGEMVEDTYDWFAQDADGNVWYLGEDTHEYEDGVAVNAHGAWEAGVDGALPGIVMPAEPSVGDAYRQEYLAGEAEDMAEVIEVGGSVEVAAGTYDDVIVTRDWTPLEPDVIEEKTYAPGIGFVFEIKPETGEALGLVEFTPGA
jgi:hypothetical protein